MSTAKAKAHGSTKITRPVVRPQPGPQTQFLKTGADIAIYGGAAGGGKTWALLIEPLRHYYNSLYGAVIFRRTYPQITNEGSLWDESFALYSGLGQPTKGNLTWQMIPGSRISMNHLQLERSVYDWHGAQIATLLWDELTHFTRTQFFYMLSRNRSMSGVKPYVRGTCNPDPDSWVATFLDWWIGEDGFARSDRAGVIRWFVRVGEDIIWANSADTLERKYGTDLRKPKSVTFIPASVFDNRLLLAANPEYLANLYALSLVDRERLLNGNWKVRAEAGKLFNRAWFDIVQPDQVPQGGTSCRFWDFAATAKSMKSKDPDYTASVKMVDAPDGYQYITDMTATQAGPAEVDNLYNSITRQDVATETACGRRYSSRWEQEPGSAAKRESERMMNLFIAIDAAPVPPRGDKIVRQKPLSRAAERHRIRVVAAPWTETFLTHMHHQPDLAHDDIADAAAGAFTALRGVGVEITEQYKAIAQQMAEQAAQELRGTN